MVRYWYYLYVLSRYPQEKHVIDCRGWKAKAKESIYKQENFQEDADG